jgi:hypothetical protein
MPGLACSVTYQEKPRPRCVLRYRQPPNTGASQISSSATKSAAAPPYWHNIAQNNTSSRVPRHRAHVDQSYDGAVTRLREQFLDAAKADKMMKRRWQMINASGQPPHLQPLRTREANNPPTPREEPKHSSAAHNQHPHLPARTRRR